MAKKKRQTKQKATVEDGNEPSAVELAAAEETAREIDALILDEIAQTVAVDEEIPELIPDSDLLAAYEAQQAEEEDGKKGRGKKKDRLNDVCTNCYKGIYRETSVKDSENGVLHCTACSHTVTRYL